MLCIQANSGNAAVRTRDGGAGLWFHKPRALEGRVHRVIWERSSDETHPNVSPDHLIVLAGGHSVPSLCASASPILSLLYFPERERGLKISHWSARPYENGWDLAD
jgi:hypothetical protein